MGFSNKTSKSDSQNITLKYEISAIFLLLLVISISSYYLFLNENKYFVKKMVQTEPREEPKNTIEIKQQEYNQKKMHFQEIKKGDNLGNILGKLKVESLDIYAAINALNKIFKANKIQVGDKGSHQANTSITHTHIHTRQQE